MKNDKPLDLNVVALEANVAEKLSDKFKDHVGQTVIQEYEKDLSSRQEWEDLADKALKLAMLEHERKDHPWENASNVKYPLITNAIEQFAARALPEIVRGNKVVEAAVIGRNSPDKEARAKRVASHMSYQLLIESSDWETSMDKMLHVLGNSGIAHKKTYYDPIKQKNVSELLTHKEFVVHREIPSLEEARRATHVLHYHDSDLISNIRAGLFIDIDLDELRKGSMHESQLYQDEEECYHELLEQHRFLDLDDDGYEEPYIVTVHRESGKVLRIVARFDPENVEENEKGEVIRIKPIHYFTDFHFLPAPDGSYYSLGFGTLLYSLNEAVNTNLNQLIDSGTLANLQGGFIGRGLRIRGGNYRHTPGEWKILDAAVGNDIAQNIVPLQYKEPSTVLFQLLGLLIESTERLSAITDVLTGQQPAQNAPATTVLALVEQGLKVFNSIQKRLHRGLKKEFEKLYRLNRLFMDPEVYFRIQDEQVEVIQSDYEDEEMDIRPISDPNMASDAQRLLRSQALLALIGTSGINNQAVLQKYLEDLDTPDPQKYIQETPPDPKMLSESAKVQDMAAKIELKQRELAIKESEQMIEMIRKMEEIIIKQDRTEAEIMEIKARAIDAIARAEAAEKGQQLDIYKAQMETLKNIQEEPNSKNVNRGLEHVEQRIEQLEETGTESGGLRSDESGQLEEGSGNEIFDDPALSEEEGAPGIPGDEELQ